MSAQANKRLPRVLSGLLPALLAVGVLVVHTAQAAEDSKPVCSVCKGTGRVLCPKHTYTEKGRFQLVCSQCTPPKCCGGLGWYPCKRCKRADVQAEWDTEFEAWKHESQHQDGYASMFGDKLDRAATRHFRIQAAFTHRQFHEYGEMLERTYAHFVGLVGEEAAKQIAWDRCLVLVYETRSPYENYVRQSAENNPNINPIWLDVLLQSRSLLSAQSAETAACRAPYKGHPRMTDNELKHFMVHSVGHVLIETVAGEKETPAWLGEGIGGHCEFAILGTPQTHCMEYGGDEKRDNKGLWADTLNKAIKNNELRPFDTLAKMTLTSMNGVDWAQSIAIINMLAMKPESFGPFALEVRNGGDAVTALQQHYGFDVQKLRAAWQTVFRRNR